MSAVQARQIFGIACTVPMETVRSRRGLTWNYCTMPSGEFEALPPRKRRSGPNGGVYTRSNMYVQLTWFPSFFPVPAYRLCLLRTKKVIGCDFYISAGIWSKPSFPCNVVLVSHVGDKGLKAWVTILPIISALQGTIWEPCGLHFYRTTQGSICPMPYALCRSLLMAGLRLSHPQDAPLEPSQESLRFPRRGYLSACYPSAKAVETARQVGNDK